MNLRQYLNNPIDPGTHRFTITGVRKYEASTGTSMLDVFLKNETDQTFRHGFALTAKGYVKLADFASTMLNADEMDHFEAEKLIGKSFEGAVAENEDGYAVLIDWWKLPIARR